MDEACLVVIRDYNEPLDIACIYSTWRKSAYYSAEPKIMESPTQFFKNQNEKIKKILPKAVIKIACLEDDPIVIVGYSICTGTHLDFVYVKTDYRRKGIGALLVPKNIETVTDQLTVIGKAIVDKKKLKTRGESDGRSEDRQKNKGI